MTISASLIDQYVYSQPEKKKKKKKKKKQKPVKIDFFYLSPHLIVCFNSE